VSIAQAPSRPEKLRLTQIQARFAKAVMRPLTQRDAIDPVWEDGKPTAAAANTIIKPNDRLNSQERLEIYNRQYWFRIWDSLGEDFPGVRRIIGRSLFYKTLTAYVTKHPSRSFTLRNLGRHLPQYLAKDKTWSKGFTPARRAMAIQMAAFEWAQMEAFDGAAKPGITPADLAGKNPAKLKLALQPYMTVLKLDYALDDFTLALKKQSLNESQKGSKPVKLPKNERIYVAVHRQEETIYYRRMTAGSFAVLTALGAGIPLEKALKQGQIAARENDMAWAASVQEFFGLWVQLGWLCLPGR
jgi:hypothetical protein